MEPADRQARNIQRVYGREGYELVWRMLRKDPAQRPTIQEVHELLKAVASRT